MCGRIAQSVEQRTENPCVVGSIPTSATKNHLIIKQLRHYLLSHFCIDFRHVGNLSRKFDPQLHANVNLINARNVKPLQNSTIRPEFAIPAALFHFAHANLPMYAAYAELGIIVTHLRCMFYYGGIVKVLMSNQDYQCYLFTWDTLPLYQLSII